MGEGRSTSQGPRHRRGLIRTLVLVGAAVVTTVVVAGVVVVVATGQPAPLRVVTEPSTGYVAGSPTTSTKTTTTTPTVPPEAATPTCRPSQLSIHEHHYPQPEGGYVASGLGNSAVVAVFVNDGTSPCDLSGYPTVAGLDAAGDPVARAVPTPSGYLGGLPAGETQLPVVTLAAGGAASAMVEGTDNPQGTATSCPTLSGLDVTAPVGGIPVRLPVAPGDCSGLEVHPIVPGHLGTEHT